MRSIAANASGGRSAGARPRGLRASGVDCTLARYMTFT